MGSRKAKGLRIAWFFFFLCPLVAYHHQFKWVTYKIVFHIICLAYYHSSYSTSVFWAVCGAKIDCIWELCVMSPIEKGLLLKEGLLRCIHARFGARTTQCIIIVIPDGVSSFVHLLRWTAMFLTFLHVILEGLCSSFWSCSSPLSPFVSSLM